MLTASYQCVKLVALFALLILRGAYGAPAARRCIYYVFIVAAAATVAARAAATSLVAAARYC